MVRDRVGDMVKNSEKCWHDMVRGTIRDMGRDIRRDIVRDMLRDIHHKVRSIGV